MWVTIIVMRIHTGDSEASPDMCYFWFRLYTLGLGRECLTITCCFQTSARCDLPPRIRLRVGQGKLEGRRTDCVFSPRSLKLLCTFGTRGTIQNTLSVKEFMRIRYYWKPFKFDIWNRRVIPDSPLFCLEQHTFEDPRRPLNCKMRC